MTSIIESIVGCHMGKIDGYNMALELTAWQLRGNSWATQYEKARAARFGAATQLHVRQ
jgi:hypothetical protein